MDCRFIVFQLWVSAGHVWLINHAYIKHTLHLILHCMHWRINHKTFVLLGIFIFLDITYLVNCINLNKSHTVYHCRTITREQSWTKVLVNLTRNFYKRWNMLGKGWGLVTDITLEYKLYKLLYIWLIQSEIK